MGEYLNLLKMSTAQTSLFFFDDTFHILLDTAENVLLFFVSAFCVDMERNNGFGFSDNQIDKTQPVSFTQAVRFERKSDFSNMEGGKSWVGITRKGIMPQCQNIFFDVCSAFGIGFECPVEFVLKRRAEEKFIHAVMSIDQVNDGVRDRLPQYNLQ